MTSLSLFWVISLIIPTLTLARPTNTNTNANQKPLSHPAPVLILLPSNRADIWDFGSEFSNTCSHLYPDIDDPLEPRFVDAKVERTLLNDDYHPDEALVSCIYQYPSGEYIQLAPFVAEELHCFPLSPSNINKARDEVATKERSRDQGGKRKFKMGRDMY
ncbi:hypothetical protein I302_103190 [Kwoniella bestiolae CBS 10118]|uniref:Uncharacterized protein n=1 Tax=Kwoniella bestiolae CBS 10118 TaxID=1296100 RepID=A0A1B9G7R9_9TREE|nr:hypothetical protein I302_01888 [Kwoniella bestiolae CBS 10118]OCF27053.1 hypothetical protein I302_01888 [Kwoniella bestiolae CBS 10118]